MDENTKTLYGAILGGQHDADLEALSGVIRERRRILQDCKATAARFTLKVGDRGTLTGIRPKYANGAMVEIHEPPMRSKVMVRVVCENPRVLARFGSIFKIPLVCFKPVGTRNSEAVSS